MTAQNDLALDDVLDVATDAWLAGDMTAVAHLGHGTPAGLVRLAERLYRRGDATEACQIYREARRQNPRVLLRGDARVLAERTRACVKREVADLMQWNPRMLRIGHSISPSVSIKKLDSSYDTAWRVWWTEEDALAAAYRYAWRIEMQDAIEAAQWEEGRVSRREVDAAARQRIADLQAGVGIGELLGQPGPLRLTVSGFALVQEF